MQAKIVSGVVIGCVGMLAARAAADPSMEKSAAPTAAPSERVVRGVMNQLPLSFEVNRGQAPEGWDFLVRCRGYHAFVASTGIVFSFDGAPLALTIEDAVASKPFTAGRELPGRVNYFIGNDPSRWVTDAPTVRGASYPTALSGATWSVTGKSRALEFTFDVEPGVEAPRLRLEGGSAVRVEKDGSLRVAMPRGEATISAPVAWQQRGAVRTDASARFVVGKDGAVRIELDRRDPSRRVHIDPTVTYATYLGGSGAESQWGVAVDASGSAYVSGTTASAGFPVSVGAYDTTLAPTDGFVAKLSGTGSELVYATFLGSSINDEMYEIDVDSSGNAYVIGLAGNGGYPVTPGVYRTSSPSGGSVLTELNPTGSALVFSTFVDNNMRDVALGPAGSVYVCDDKNLSRYSAGGTSLVFRRVIDPPTSFGAESMSVIAATSDAAGDAYVTGTTSKTNYPLTAGAYQTTLKGQKDVFVTKITSGNTIAYATLLGGNAADIGNSIGVNWSGQAFVVGTTASTNFPTTAGAYRTTLTPTTTNDSFFARLNATGTALKYSTYLGGSGTSATSIRVHPCGTCVICGGTADSMFPTTANALQPSYAGGTSYDGMIMKFNPDNSLAMSSFYGGTESDFFADVGMAPDGSVVFGGTTSSNDFPLVNAYQAMRPGSGDVVLLAIPDTLPTTLTAPTLAPGALPDWTITRPLSKTIVPAGGIGPFVFTITSGTLPTGLTLTSAGLLSGTPTQVGAFPVTIRVDDVCEMTATTGITMRIHDLPTIPNAAMQGWTVDIPVDQLVVTAGGAPPLTFKMTFGSPPAGTTFGMDGRIVGTPPTVGTAAFTVSVEDASGAVATRAMTFRVSGAPSVDPLLPPPCTAGRPYGFQFETTDGTAPFTWAVVAGSPPAPLVAATGMLSGVTKPAGSYSFTLRATDAAGVTAERAFSATSNPLPQLTTIALPPAAIGRPYSAHLASSGGTASFVWGVETGDLPGGLTLDPATGTLSGTPTGTGTDSVTLRVTDACGAAATRGFEFGAGALVGFTGAKSGETLSIVQGGALVVSRTLELTEGATLGISLKGGANGGKLPVLVLQDGGGQPIDVAALTKANAKTTTVKGFVVPSTGRYFLRLRPAPGFKGKMKLAVSVAPPKTWPGSATLGPAAPAEFRFSAPKGALLSITATAPKGSLALPKIVSILDAEGVDLLAGGTTKDKPRATSFASAVPLAGGDYRVVFSTRDANEGAVAWTVKLKAAKSYEFALPDLAAGD